MRDAPSRTRRALAALAAGALGLGLGVAFGPADAPDPVEPAARADAVPPGGPPVPRSDSRAPIPGAEPPARLGERSPEGAIGAATAHLRALADERLLDDPASRRALASRVAVPGYRAELAERLDGAYAQLAAGWPAGVGEGILRAYPLGHRLEHYEPGRATVALWSAVVHPDASGRPAVAWTVSRAAMRHTSAGWRLERHLSDEPGPAPAPAAGAESSAAEFAAGVATFEPYRR